MLASELPFEILLNISRFLHTKDKFHCMFICRAWKIPFQESMWRKVCILDKKKLEAICSTSAIKDNIYLNGHNTRDLYLNGKIRATDSQLYALQLCFQNLRRLYIKRNCLNETDFGKQADWNLWKYLEDLCIVLDELRIEDTEKVFLDIVSCLPRLKRLDLIRHSWKTKLAFTMKDFETLHKHLPRLEYLTLSVDLGSLSREELLQARTVDPATNLTVFKVDTKIADHRWLYYFAQKYPNIHTLRWEPYDKNGVTDDYQEETSFLLKGVRYAFQRLKTLNVHSAGSSDWLHLFFWKILCPSSLQIRNISCRPYLQTRKPEILEEIIRMCMDSFSRTVETLSIKGRYRFNIPHKLTELFVYSPHLVYLNIDQSDASIILDELLDRCVVLKRLRFACGWISVSPDSHNSLGRHGLRMIEIYDSTIDTDTFDYLSFHCRHLNYLSLTDIKAIGKVSPKTGSLCLNMSYSSFEILHIFGIQLYPSEDNINPNTVVNIMVFSRPIPGNKKPENDTSNATVFGSKQSKIFTESTWFHLYCDEKDMDKGAHTTRIMRKKEVNQARKYYRHFQRNKSAAKKLDDIRSIDGQTTRYGWKKDLPRGYAVLKCGDVAKYVIGSELTDAEIFWKNIFDSLT
ncbi:hypothetical protein PHYBLDRAFT_65393 [Phycomyces blakesleeanus NRRL 1555(-)]|uniref:F-box domain-containing protein n=1 Tax=Phycomyces blakesleeanus (strain ATCC 8743b / DSM 1359 / FGSC 10004 / NBRC 33097 / NRRL 1555) TaxID=763407 RepID=A0A167MDT1_PHYB8|nr:hypothetical protein PHYBLDRAFT_65393 [Phycomyces blakesleeanus NRRL 1555(-)]OAD72564.1 hypothetical protein PHYBLDRAFT_65393 [Phycomyces blakesleeanus NRRL 1555(-)]|eukprot:XP_018290604.1 hypothetical protein PHYBLDRAFT_65393 [Phycomyces blakesleeanus NRRL 1555(-)]